jgi:hypothetical protein
MVDAADTLSRMISLSPSLLLHTPFFICAIALQALIHLGAYSLPLWQLRQPLIKQQVHMGIGALKRLGEVWDMANIILKEVKAGAKGVLLLSHTSSIGNGKAVDSEDVQHIFQRETFDEMSLIQFEDPPRLDGNTSQFFIDFLDEERME